MTIGGSGSEPGPGMNYMARRILETAAYRAAHEVHTEGGDGRSLAIALLRRAADEMEEDLEKIVGLGGRPGLVLLPSLAGRSRGEGAKDLR